MNTQSSLSFGFSDSIPLQKMHFSFLLYGSPNKVPGDFVKIFVNIFRELYVTHNMGKDSIKGRFCKDHSPSHVQSISFPNNQLVSHIIQEVLGEPLFLGLLLKIENLRYLPKEVFSYILRAGTHRSLVLEEQFLEK